MDAKHTPGPWTMTEECGVEPLASDGEPIMSFRRPHDELMANARLIVAAPELLEALVCCQRLRGTLEMYGLAEMVDSAIAKAKGEQC